MGQNSLDWLLFQNEEHLERVLEVFVTHYNEYRPHRALSLAPSEPRRSLAASAAGEVRVHRRDRLGGVIHEYILAGVIGFLHPTGVYVDRRYRAQSTSGPDPSPFTTRWSPELLRSGRVMRTSVDVNRLDGVMGHYEVVRIFGTRRCRQPRATTG